MIDNDPVFEQIINHTLVFEGSYSNDPADPGGETRYGISKRSYPHVDIAALTITQARAIYYRDYYKSPHIDRIVTYADAPQLAAKVFDLGVNTGHRRAIQMLQRAINQVCAGEVAARRAAPWRQKIARLIQGKPLATDGIIGPVTLGVLRACPHHDALLMALKGEAYQHYIKLGKPRFISGWLRRLGADA
ncbi:MAG: glycosyl hydrolase 108 family protein [Desulfuromonadaceae bacterium]|nr:glycosyl hydrolase 108 family protein [Desulfuromonadaceae bacterium]